VSRECGPNRRGYRAVDCSSLQSSGPDLYIKAIRRHHLDLACRTGVADAGHESYASQIPASRMTDQGTLLG
jgi:hypothetical protein